MEREVAQRVNGKGSLKSVSVESSSRGTTVDRRVGPLPLPPSAHAQSEADHAPLIDRWVGNKMHGTSAYRLAFSHASRLVVISYPSMIILPIHYIAVLVLLLRGSIIFYSISIRHEGRLPQSHSIYRRLPSLACFFHTSDWTPPVAMSDCDGAFAPVKSCIPGSPFSICADSVSNWFRRSVVDRLDGYLQLSGSQAWQPRPPTISGCSCTGTSQALGPSIAELSMSTQA